LTQPRGQPSASSTVDDLPRPVDHADMRRLNRQLVAIGEAHPFPYAVAVGLVAGLLGFLIGWVARREWIWFLFIVPAVVSGASLYTQMHWRHQDRDRLERHPD
jgi:ABC-type branched-subunit amino acid transport system permease subunit